MAYRLDECGIGKKVRQFMNIKELKIRPIKVSAEDFV